MLCRTSSPPALEPPVAFRYNYALKLALLPAELHACVVVNDADAETWRFLHTSARRARDRRLTALHTWYRTLLAPVLSVTAINGALGRGRMFVLSTAQIAAHLQHAAGPAPAGPPRPATLLDIGAGDGHVTHKFVPLLTLGAAGVYATETCPIMQRRLTRRGFTVLPLDAWQNPRTYDLIACLNVLDRCDDAAALLRSIYAALAPGPASLAVVALALPYRPCVEVGAARLPPAVPLPLPAGAPAEVQLAALVSLVLAPAGFAVAALSRAPYLCEGDADRDFYLLHDYILVLRRAGAPAE